MYLFFTTEEYNYNKAVVSDSLWFAEGITSYYDLALPMIAGLSSTEDYFADLSFMSYDDFLDVKNLGSKHADEVIEALENSGYIYKDNENSKSIIELDTNYSAKQVKAFNELGFGITQPTGIKRLIRDPRFFLKLFLSKIKVKTL